MRFSAKCATIGARIEARIHRRTAHAIHIDTIPVWDAAKIDGECLLCALQRRVELQQIEYSLGASVMEPDVRIQVNKKGFCQHHQRMLFKGDNRLGHALMLESHLTETRGKLNKAFNDIRKAPAAIRPFSTVCPAKRVTRQGDGSRCAGA